MNSITKFAASGFHGAAIANAPGLASPVIANEVIDMKIGFVVVALQIDSAQSCDTIAFGANGKWGPAILLSCHLASRSAGELGSWLCHNSLSSQLTSRKREDQKEQQSHSQPLFDQ